MADSTEPVRLVVSLLAREETRRAEAMRRLAERFGLLVYLSEPMAFDHTDYYTPEMGSPLTRRLAAFEEMVKPEKLPVMKNICASVEADLSVGGRRAVNIDPGLLSTDSLVLASTKNSPHRICLAPGCYAEVVLVYHHGAYHVLPWTYPDYAGPQIQEILVSMRRRYLWQMKRGRCTVK